MTGPDRKPESAADHPQQLFWYVAGRLEPDGARRVEAHLRACADCRSVVGTLEAWRPTILHSSRAGEHPGPEELDAYVTGYTSIPRERLSLVEAHLGDCADCRYDVEGLRRTYAAPAAAVRSEMQSAPLVRRWAAAALLIVTLGALGWLLSGRREAETVLMPARRNAVPAPVLAGSGPWRVTLVLPSEAPAGSYRLWVERTDGTIVARLPDSEADGSDGRLVIQVPLLDAPGTYRIGVLQPGDDHGVSHLYTFRVEPARGE